MLFKTFSKFLLTVLVLAAINFADAQTRSVHESVSLNSGNAIIHGRMKLDYKTSEPQLSSVTLDPTPTTVKTIIDNGPSENRIDLVFIGDGFTAEEGGAT